MADDRPAPAAEARCDAFRRGPATLATLVARVARPMLREHGLADARLVTEWPTIAGADLAEFSRPERLSRGREGEGGTLRVRVAGAAALDMQYRAALIVERINRFFGYKAVARLALVQGPLPPRPSPAPAPAPDPAAEAALAATVARVADDELRQSLLRFGRALRAREVERRGGGGRAL